MRVKVGVLVVLAVLFGFSGSAMASGFALAEQSVSGLGNAFAGGAASAEDASTVWFNPAGMTRIKGKQAMAAMHVIIPKAKFTNKGSLAATTPIVAETVNTTPPHATITPAIPSFGLMGGGNGGDAGGAAPVPNAYYVETFDTGWSFGLGINVPFGLSTEYDRNWVGRYHGVKSEVQTINLNPAAAHKVNDNFSYGFGVSIQHLDASLSNAVDFGLLDALGFFDPVLTDGTKDPVFLMTPQGDDGFTEAEGDSWGFGFNIGFLYEFDDSKRVGFAYRSKIEHDVDGDVTWALPTTNNFHLAMAANNTFQNGGVKVDIKLPSSASLSYYQDVNEKLSFMVDIQWTEWSVLDKLVLNYADTTPDGVTTFEWDDTMRYSVGVTYQYNDKCKLRGGIAFDETPIPNEVLRGVRVPGEDRTWLTLGGSHSFDNGWSFDLAYAHIMTDDPKINKVNSFTSEDVTRGWINGEYDASVSIISGQLNYNF